MYSHEELIPCVFLPYQKMRSPTGINNHAVPLLNYYHHELKDWITAFQDSDSLSLSTTCPTFTCTSPVSLKAPYVSNTGSQKRLRNHHIMRTSDCLLSKFHCSPSWKCLFPYVATSIWSCSWQHWFQKKCCYWADQNSWHQWMRREKSIRSEKAPSRPLPICSLIYQHAVPYGLAKLKATS